MMAVCTQFAQTAGSQTFASQTPSSQTFASQTLPSSSLPAGFPNSAIVGIAVGLGAPILIVAAIVIIVFVRRAKRKSIFTVDIQPTLTSIHTSVSEELEMIKDVKIMKKLGRYKGSLIS